MEQKHIKTSKKLLTTTTQRKGDTKTHIGSFRTSEGEKPQREQKRINEITSSHL